VGGAYKAVCCTFTKAQKQSGQSRTQLLLLFGSPTKCFLENHCRCHCHNSRATSTALCHTPTPPTAHAQWEQPCEGQTITPKHKAEMENTEKLLES